MVVFGRPVQYISVTSETWLCFTTTKVVLTAGFLKYIASIQAWPGLLLATLKLIFDGII
jgi:hypothetical protein